MSAGRRRALPRQRFARIVGAAAVVLVAGLVLAPVLGSTSIDLGRVWADPWNWAGNPDAAIFFVARLPRVLLAALVGAALALAGAVFQSLLRNPLATPYTIGISAGATLGAFLGMRWGPAGLGGELLVPACALAGALASTFVVFTLSLRGGRVPTTVLLLAGVTLNYTLGAVIMLLQYFADHTETARMVRWMMGDLEGASYRLLALIAVAALPAIWLLSRRGLAFNLLSLGEEEAAVHGVDSRRTILVSLLLSAWVTGLSVAVAGPVGFVGIIVPHAFRLMGGADYRILLPATILGGAGFLMLCDTLARTLLAPMELPIGVLTASLGGPFFLALLLRQRAA